MLNKEMHTQSRFVSIFINLLTVKLSLILTKFNPHKTIISSIPYICRLFYKIRKLYNNERLF
jgi:hypothetical protein